MSASDGHAYVVERVLQGLSTDERTHVLDIGVRCEGGHVFLSGRVPCNSRRNAIEEVVRQLVPSDLSVVNEIDVVEVGGLVDEETVT